MSKQFLIQEFEPLTSASLFVADTELVKKMLVRFLLVKGILISPADLAVMDRLILDWAESDGVRELS